MTLLGRTQQYGGQNCRIVTYVTQSRANYYTPLPRRPLLCTLPPLTLSYGLTS